MTLLCVPLVAKTVEQMMADMAAAKARGADLVEVRLDHLSDFEPRRDLRLLVGDRPLPVLVTYRPKWEGGEHEGDDKQRFEALCLAMELGAEYVDVELKVADDFVRLISEKKPDNFKLIISSHNYQSTPSSEELSSLVARIQAAGADIVKIATTAVDIVDVTRMFQVIVHCQVLFHCPLWTTDMVALNEQYISCMLHTADAMSLIEGSESLLACFVECAKITHAGSAKTTLEQ